MGAVGIWFVIGTRRWARLLVTELCAILPPSAVIYMQGSPEDEELQAWLLSTGLGMRIRVSACIPQCSLGMTGVAFVINSAYLHKISIEDMLTAGYNVVCEKPISFSKKETLDLFEMAKELGLQLFCTNTFLFASYLDKFRENWLTGRHFNRMSISWADSISEIRYGETKGYDSSLPILYDVLPHIANIILVTIGPYNIVPTDIKVRRGGCQVSIHYRQRDLDIYVALERNATKRIRILEFAGEDRKLSLDFSSEPGCVSIDQHAPVHVDPTWSEKPKPIAAMILSVREFFESGTLDPRLSVSACLHGNDLIDSVVNDYVAQQVSLLSPNAVTSESTVAQEDLDYACKEVKSITARTLPYICEDSPLRALSLAASLTQCSI